MRSLDTQPAFFFDRDGIVNQRIIDGYVTDVDDFIFLPDIFALLKHVKDAGFLAILVTNQQGVAKGLMSDADLANIHTQMQKRLVHEAGTAFDDIFVATELDTSRKICCGDRTEQQRRKPSPAMLLEAAKKWNINLPASWMLGDSRSDSEAGRAAGARTILVGNFQSDEADIVLPSVREVWAGVKLRLYVP
jgi:D-glycero-D-manno-heptose 1,7-bisphosphate phosphatase